MISNYLLGVLYGDGYFLTTTDNYIWFYFSTTHKELADKIQSFLDEFEIKYFAHNRQFEKGHEKENYEILEIVKITDKDFLDFLTLKGFKSKSPSGRIKIDRDFIRGYLETKGTLFKSYSRGAEFWRISFSGNYGDVTYIKENLESKLGIIFSNIVQRKEREEMGIISESYRINIQNRHGLAKLIEFIEGEEISEYLKQRIEGFFHFHKTTPFNMKTKIFKHYKFAVGFMARELEYDIRGVRGGGGTRGFKPVYLWENDTPFIGFRGWKNAYEWICKEYNEKTGYNPPKVSDIS